MTSAPRRGDLSTLSAQEASSCFYLDLAGVCIFSWSLYFLLVLFILFIFSVLVPYRLCGKTLVIVSLFNWLWLK